MTTMTTITGDWLQDHNACAAGLAWAVDLLPADGLVVEDCDLTALWALAHGERDQTVRGYAVWAAQRTGGLLLRDADLRYADLRDADLRDANLCDANLRYANLCGANLCKWKRGPDGYARLI